MYVLIFIYLINFIKSELLNKNFIHHQHDNNINQQIFINQSNNIYILAKYGQTVNLPCVVFRQRNQDLSNIHTIWNKLNDKQRPVVLSVGTQQLKQDMRYRIKVNNMNKVKSQFNNEPLIYSEETDIKFNENEHRITINENNIINDSSFDLTTSTSMSSNHRHKYIIQNWQLEIRKLTYEDAGTYQCLLPLVKPLTKNITLQVIPDLVIEPREGNYKIDDKIVIKCKATLKYTQKDIKRQQKPNIHWYKENQIIKTTNLNSRSTLDKNEPKIEIDTKQDQNENSLNSVLTIHNAKLDDSGKYKCIYENIQEQVEVKVIYDYFEYKNYMSSRSEANNCNRVLVNPSFNVFIFYIIMSWYFV